MGRQKTTVPLPEPLPPSPDRINAILNDLEVKFIDCKIIIPTLNNAQLRRSNFGRGGTRRVNNPRRNFFEKLFSPILSGQSTAKRNEYTNCIFQTGLEQQIKTYLNSFRTEHIHYTFINCRFIKRRTGIFENIGFKLRNMIGIRFNVDYGNSFKLGCIEIMDYKLKVNCIPKWTRMVIEQVAEED